ncbi:MAG TPA: aminotransferase class I/II-fold pyridoxal phosphate-dependent enzyme [Chloroflexota bacterium]|nr:aminotransferase class I/II-fold pyridoxal phosphate-dependent enzyme [Chloroflexota bacterium]
MQLNPVLTALRTYPFLKLDEAKAQAAARGLRIIDFGVGDPRERTDDHIRRALADNLPQVSSYPAARGLPELRAAIAGWLQRRYGVCVDPEREVIPTLGSKEAIFLMALAVGDPRSRKNLVAVPEPAYPVAERGALFAGFEPLHLPLHEANGFLPDLAAVPAETWERIAIFWVNYPNNPTAATAPLDFYEELSQLALRHDFLLASDEAYAEIYFGRPPDSALQVSDRTNVAVVTTLSKRSSMTGYRSGAIVASPWLIEALRAFRPAVGVAPQEFVQRASIWAWNDESHVASMRAIYAAKREALLPVLERKRLRVAGCDATFYLWVEVPGGDSSEDFACRLLEGGVVVAPGSYFGPAGEGYFRLALVPTLEECRAAASILEELL